MEAAGVVLKQPEEFPEQRVDENRALDGWDAWRVGAEADRERRSILELCLCVRTV